MFTNYAAQAGVIAGRNFASVNIEWNFDDVTVLGFDPFPSNINDRPRINTWRSDGTNLIYMSGGRYVFYPPFSSNGQIFEPWGDRRTGARNVNIPLIGNTFAGVDAFIPSGVNITFEPPLGPNSWQLVGVIEGENQYQYLLKNGNNPTLKVVLNQILTPPSGYFEFLSNSNENRFNNSYLTFRTSNNSDVNYELYSMRSGFKNNSGYLISL